ncbi:hypothetical protein R75461_07282 [Paraburkholderia nemoris]|nr:hypothetical protein R75461_07282 [Paraburkholderia nemoris]
MQNQPKPASSQVPGKNLAGPADNATVPNKHVGETNTSDPATAVAFEQYLTSTLLFILGGGLAITVDLLKTDPRHDVLKYGGLAGISFLSGVVFLVIGLFLRSWNLQRRYRRADPFIHVMMAIAFAIGSGAYFMALLKHVHEQPVQPLQQRANPAPVQADADDVQCNDKRLAAAKPANSMSAH